MFCFVSLLFPCKLNVSLFFRDCIIRIYRSERYGDVSYEIPVPLGDYEIILHFAEVFWNEAGKRIFDLDIEGETFKDVDLFVVGGNKRLVAFTIEAAKLVDDGFVSIQLTTTKDNAKLSGYVYCIVFSLLRNNDGCRFFVRLSVLILPFSPCPITRRQYRDPTQGTSLRPRCRTRTGMLRRVFVMLVAFFDRRRAHLIVPFPCHSIQLSTRTTTVLVSFRWTQVSGHSILLPCLNSIFYVYDDALNRFPCFLST